MLATREAGVKTNSRFFYLLLRHLFHPGRKCWFIAFSLLSPQSHSLWQLLLAQPEKLLCAGNGIGRCVLPVDDDRRRKIGGPDR